ncbi:MAG: type IV toxin-antitoxin system AbiEi family antitoxin domain-containing protein [Nocardioides sp.]|jgi:hypothetical protein
MEFRPQLDTLLSEQAGVVRRAQLDECGYRPADVQRLVRNRLLNRVHPGVYLDHTGEPSWLQSAWAGVLAVWPAALVHGSALRAYEGPGRRGDSAALLQVGVDRARHVVAPLGVQVHRVPRFHERVQWNLGPPRMRYDDAALEVAIRSATDLDAIAVLSRAVQGRRTTAGRLLEVLDARPRASRRAWLTAVLKDIDEGTCSVLEHGYLTLVERAHGLPVASRQLPGTSTQGLLYRDAAYDFDLLIELDGRLDHDSVADRERDFERDLDAAVSGFDTRRISWGQVYERPCSTAGKIAVLLARRGWERRPQACGPGCDVSAWFDRAS